MFGEPGPVVVMSCDITAFFNLHLFVQDAHLKTISLNVAPLSPVMDAKVKMLMLTPRQKGKHDSITQEKSKMMFSQGQCGPSMGGKKREKPERGGGNLQNGVLCSPAVYTALQRL